MQQKFNNAYNFFTDSRVALCRALGISTDVVDYVDLKAKAEPAIKSLMFIGDSAKLALVRKAWGDYYTSVQNMQTVKRENVREYYYRKICYRITHSGFLAVPREKQAEIMDLLLLKKEYSHVKICHEFDAGLSILKVALYSRSIPLINRMLWLCECDAQYLKNAMGEVKNKWISDGGLNENMERVIRCVAGHYKVLDVDTTNTLFHGSKASGLGAKGLAL